MKDPNIWCLQELIRSASTTHTKHEGQWIPARPEGYSSILHRFRAAWLVFIGDADAVKWPGGQ